MIRHVALLRGINVGRAKRVAMTDLRVVFAILGYGNVVFSSTEPLAQDAATLIEAALQRRTGMQAAVLLISAEEFVTVAAENPRWRWRPIRRG